MDNLRPGAHVRGQSATRIRILTRDPPGQRSIYIPPGNTEEESYRVTTYTRFPNRTIDIRQLAKYGFYYVGYQDRTKCFCCGVSVQSWTQDDNPASSIFHNYDCEFSTGIFTRNIPINNFFSTLNISGPHINGVFTQTPPTTIQHPAPYLLLDLSSNPATTNQSTQSEAANLANLYPCNNPINPHMRTMNARMETFAFGWDNSRTRATPRQFAESGLYYLGDRDRVKCFYCNGGLQNWSFEERPFFEHTKWYPMCEFILQQKGPAFVHDIVQRFPNLIRPLIRNPSRHQVRSGLQSARNSPTQQHMENNNIPIIHSFTFAAPESFPPLIDPRDRLQQITQRIEIQMQNSEIVNQAIQRGIERETIKAVVKRRMELNLAPFVTLEQLLESIANHPVDTNADTDHENISTSVTPSMSTESSLIPTPSSAPSSSHDQILRLEEEKKCKICKQQSSKIVFFPCGHLVSCIQCSTTQNYCPICKVAISERVRVFVT